MDYELIVPVLGILVGGLIILVPLAGLVLRYALKPAIETYVQAKRSVGPTSDEEVRMLEQRLARVEAQLRALTAERMELPGRRD